MLSEEQIKQSLHAHRVLPVGVANPHGPLGLEQLAEAVSRLSGSPTAASRVERPIALPVETWEKLDHLARRASQTQPHPLTASDMAAAILEQAIGGE